MFAVFVTILQVAQFDSVALLDTDPFTEEIQSFLAFEFPERVVGRIGVEVPWVCRSEHGTEMKIDGTLEELVIRTSICNHPFVISDALDLSVVMPYPVQWNSFRVWTVALSFANSHLQYMADHVLLL